MGYLLGLVSAATFGLIPFFSLPLMRGGLGLETVLFYRFFFAVLFLGVLLVLRRERFYVPLKDLGKTALLSLMYASSALLYFRGFSEAPSGLATTVHFTYPLMVMLLMIGFFHERFSWFTLCALLLAVTGVALLLGVGQGGHSISLSALLILLASALANGLYIAGIHAARVRHASGLVFTFYILGFSAFYTFANAQLRGSFVWVSAPDTLGSLFALAVVTAVISNATLVVAVKRIGSTATALLGAMEPLTAVLVGIFVFSEPFSPSLAVGVAFILGSVAAVMLGPQVLEKLRRS